jgi:hypothetical protein
MGYKHGRLGPRIVAAARDGARYRDVHVFFGGTGAVGGTALLQMIDLYEEMMSIAPAGVDDVPVLVTTGVTSEELGGFTRRLFRWIESRHGKEHLPKGVRSGYLTRSGVFVALERFVVEPLPGLASVRRVPLAARRAEVDRYLRSIGAGVAEPAERVFEALERAIGASRPFTGFLEGYRAQHLAGRPPRYRSVVVGIPLPSLIAYHLDGLEEVARQVPGIDGERLDRLKRDFELALRDDVAAIEQDHADHVLVAHTTAVGGMYDEGDPPRIRLGFAHSAVDQRIGEKQRAADALTRLYAEAGIKLLITAAAIGVDEVLVDATVPIHPQVRQKLFDAPRELFAGAQEALPPEAKKSRAAGRPVPRRQRIRRVVPLTVPLDAPAPREVTFEAGREIKLSYAIRSGENGYFTVANSDALYRVMRVASASELGLVLAVAGLFGDDPHRPWFRDNICYYTETDNSRQVFDFLAQPALQQAQLNGLDPLSLQDLGGAKHQGELHTLGLLILLHRLRTLDIDAIPPYVDLERFDARTFFVTRSRPLLFEDLMAWDLEELARDLAVLVGAGTPEDLLALKPFARHHDLFPLKRAARLKVLETVRDAVFAVPSIGSPILFEQDRRAMVRTGYFAAPLDLLVTDAASIDAKLRELWQANGRRAPFDVFRDHLVCTRGFVDLRPHAIVSAARDDSPDLADRVVCVTDDAALRDALARIEPYSQFSTCGLVATMFRLRALAATLREAMIELGTLQDHRWHMPRDEFGHVLVVPSVVEAFRMVAEGLEKSTGTDRLAGGWGYERRRPPDRSGLVGNR